MRILIAALVMLMLPQALEARGGGGGGGGHGGGGHGGGRGGGTVGFFGAGNFGFQPNTSPMNRGFSRPGFRVARPFVRHQPLRVANRVGHNRFDGQRLGNRFDGGQQWTGWPAWGWSGGGYSGYSQPAVPAEPQVIILSDASPAPAQRVAVIEPQRDYSYAGCHPIPNGYRCGQ